METKTIFRVIGNTDTTEGRGDNYTIAFCEIKATAVRFAKGKGTMGSNAHIETVEIGLRPGANVWWGPIVVQTPTATDQKLQGHLDDINSAKEKAAKLGLTAEEIKLLANITK